ncbi:MAG: glycogen debranching protein [Cyclobacteriaceae bacterium]|nr:glycogen debranching protein [Cyclobacteriaceae bacterium]
MNRLPLLFAILFIACSHPEKTDFRSFVAETSSIIGKSNYLNSPFLTAGDRVYLVGHQDGTFPELGWHIKGEMGGIWNHPIKLMDGFDVELTWADKTLRLNHADTFVNYPFANKHGYALKDQNLHIERWQFVPDGKEGIVVQYLLTNSSTAKQDFNLTFTGHSDLRPTWLGEQTNMMDGKDKAIYNPESDLWLVKDSINTWYTLFGADQTSIDHQGSTTPYSGKGTSASLSYPISIPPKGTKVISFTIAGSYASDEAALTTFQSIQRNLISDFNEKKLRYEKLANQSKLTIPDKHMQEAFEWLKYNCDWLIRSVPEIGTGITAGMPDYPWWFGVDSEYALKGYMAIGHKEVVYKTIQLLDSMSNVVNGNGRIIHEMSTNGVVFNKGNINETPQFASLIWEVYQWNGDRIFLEKYFPTIKKGLRWLMTENDANKNLFPDGFGMMEIHGLNSEMIDVAAYTQRAFDDAAKIARELGDPTIAASYQEIANNLKIKINQEFWSEEFNSYADFIGTDKQALKLIDDAIVRADTLNKPWAVAELNQTKSSILKNPSSKPRPFVLYHNWVVNTPMEMKIADEEKAARALVTAEKFVNPFGVFVTGIDRDESAGSDDGSFKGSKVFSYTGAVMTLPTGVLAVAENNYGHPDKALNYLKKMSRTFSYALPGSMYEVSPDYGMTTQAWNIYSFAVPIVQQFFGVTPDAAQKKVLIKLQMPTEWNEASLEHVAVADNEVSIFFKRSGNQISLKVTQQNPDWTLELILPKGTKPDYKIILGKGDSIEIDSRLKFTSASKVVELTLMLKD